MIDKITLIIPTNNRQNFLTRVLNYYNNTNIKILVADSSRFEYSQKNNFNIEYFHYINFSYTEKFADIIKKVDTPYVVFCADDDFIVPNAIKQSIKFLDKHKDYIAVGGYYINFWTIFTGNNNKLFKWSHIYYDKEITSSKMSFNIRSRLILHFASYIPTFYYVHRTKYLKIFFNILINCNLDPIFSELLTTMLTVIYGKVKLLNILYSARDAHEGRITKRNSIYDYIKDKTYFGYYKNFRNILVNHLIKNTNFTQKEAIKTIDGAVIIWRKMYDNRTIINSTNKLRFVLYYICTYIRVDFKNLFFLFFKSLFPNRYYYFKILFRKKYDNPKSKFFDDFNNIKKVVLLHS